ncbi:uncharacterized protein LOC144120004 [Amblyomma americanum]
MLPAALSISLLAAADIVLATNFEDDSRYFGSQQIRMLTTVNDLLYVRRRNFPSNTIVRCHAMRKDERLGINSFRYFVYTALNPQQTEYTIFPTPLATSMTHPHTVYNAAAFMTELGGEMSLFKLMYAAGPQGCFILVRTRAHGVRAEF